MWHALAGHKAALENNFEDAVEKIKSGSTTLGAAAVCLIVISLMALAVWIFQNDAGVFFTLVPALAIAIPAAILGVVRLQRAFGVLSAKAQGSRKPLVQFKSPAVQVSAADTTYPLAEVAERPASVTEHTTLNLESPAPASDEAPARR